MSSHSSPAHASPSLTARLGLCLLSAASLTFEINLTRLFSVAQFYHFAFMIVSVALLGFGASGTALALLSSLCQKPAKFQKPVEESLGWLGLAAGASTLGAYLLTNWLPLDSFSLAWDSKQVGVLVLHYLVLASPFFFSGFAVGLLLAAFPQAAGQTYAANLLGSALGCVLALVAPPRLGGEGTVVLSSGLATLVPFISLGKATPNQRPVAATRRFWPWAPRVLSLGLLVCAFVDLVLRFTGQPSFAGLDLRLSPYKNLSYALQYPGAQVIYRRWNAFSRIDVVRSSGVRSLPGLSYRYLQPPPPEDGLLVDGDDLSAIVLPNADPEFAAYLPAAIGFRLRPQAETLVLEPRGGLDIFLALAQGARRVTAVEANSLIVEAAGAVYDDPRVDTVVESDRSYLRRTSKRFDIIVLSLTTAYHPVRSGAYSLAEDYRDTVEAFEAALARLKPDGLLIVTRWLQMPPSECLRAFALAATAMERSGGDPHDRIVAFRGYNTATLLAKNSPFTAGELSAIREFAASRAYDMTYALGLRPEESNRYNILPEPVYYQAFTALLSAQPRTAFYAAYPYEITPPTDDRPFFGHFFKWSQAGQVWAELGKTWQPFGGAGYFVILALLALATLLAGLLILLPLAAQGFVVRARGSAGGDRPPPRPTAPQGAHDSRTPALAMWFHFLYFSLIGFAYLLVEIPLIQRFILYLGHPAYAMTAVLFGLLLFSGMGSQWGRRISLQTALVVLVVLLLCSLVGLPALLSVTLGLPLTLRLGVTVLLLAPIGFLMGIPLPAGIQRLLRDDERATEVPWLWAVNGSASVVSAVLAALLALSFGFTWVLTIGVLGYGGAWLVARRLSRRA